MASKSTKRNFYHNPDFQFDIKPFDNLARALAEFGVTVRQALDGFVENFPLPDWLLKDTRPLKQRLDEDGWQSVDARDLSIEDRWVYQKWIWSAPIRWWRRIQK